jgi:hypothetical protein
VAYISVKVMLDAAELNALAHMAQGDCRANSEQLRYLLRQAARRRGLLAGRDTREPKERQSTDADQGSEERSQCDGE